MRKAQCIKNCFEPMKGRNPMSKHEQFTVNGKPFFAVGGQAHNSTSYVLDDLILSFAAVEKLNGNSMAVTICWDRFEPVEGQFDRQYVTDIIQLARNRGMRLVLLWFASWKNGIMGYCPVWVKQDSERFQRVLSGDMRAAYNLSCHCPANVQADAKAFARLCETVREFDRNEQTVIAIQIENEAGHFSGARRDFHPEATKAFESDVPGELMAYLAEHPDCTTATYWKRAGKKSAGNWVDVFGRFGAEAFTAYSVARYIDQVAAAGNREYDTFLYINIALDGGSRGEDWEIPGMSYFSGGAVHKVLDIYYATCKHLDAICPDNYKIAAASHKEELEWYANPESGWPLYVPESGENSVNVSHMMYAAAELQAIGYHVFGVESYLGADGELRPGAEGVARSLLMLKNIAPFLVKPRKYKLYSIYQNTGESCLQMELENWRCYVTFVGFKAYLYGNIGADFRHPEMRTEMGKNLMDFQAEKGRGILVETDENEFYLVGHGFHMFFNPYEPLDGSLPNLWLNPTLQLTTTEYLEVTEGHFDESDQYIVDRIRNGDENWLGVWASADCGVIRFRLLPRQ